MAKTITAAELAALKARGSKIKRETQEMNIAGFNDLVKHFQQIADDNRRLMERQSASVADALNNLAAVLSTKDVDAAQTTILIEELVKVQKLIAAQSIRPEYQFDIVRDNMNLTKQITAKPIIKAAH